jgi:hypothetical protein
VSVPSPRRRFRRIALIAMAVVVTAAVAVTVGLVVIGSGEPLLDNASSGGASFWGGNTTTPGQVVDFPVEVENPGAQAAVLLSATLIPVPGFPTPRLVHLAVLDEHRERVTSAVGWPPSDTKCSVGPTGRCTGKGTTKVFPSRPLRGFVVLPHDRHGPGPLPDMIEYGVVGSRPGQYGTAGLALRYRIGSADYVVNLYAGGLDCVARSSSAPTCNTFKSTDRFASAFNRLLDGS